MIDSEEIDDTNWVLSKSWASSDGITCSKPS